MSFSLSPSNILVHITMYNVRFHIILKLLDQMSILTPVMNTLCESKEEITMEKTQM